MTSHGTVYKFIRKLKRKWVKKNYKMYQENKTTELWKRKKKMELKETKEREREEKGNCRTITAF